MDTRTVEFIRALRAAGVRISISETQDALNAMNIVGILDRSEFYNSLKATLVKEHNDGEIFEFFFPLFFENNAPPMWDIQQELDPDQQDLLQRALEALMQENPQALQDFLDQLMQVPM